MKPTRRLLPHHLNPATLPSLLQHFITSPFPSHAQTLHAQILTSSLPTTTPLLTKLLILHLKSNSLHNARHLFDRMPHPPLSAYNYLLAAYLKHNLTHNALRLLHQLLHNVAPDAFTLSMILKISSLQTLDTERQVHCKALRTFRDDPDAVFHASLIHSYGKNRNMKYARRVYDVVPGKSVVSSTALIAGYMGDGDVGAAEDVFCNMAVKDNVVYNAMIEGYSRERETAGMSLGVYRDMQRLGFRMTISTFVSVIGACTVCSDLGFGEQVHCDLVKTGLFSHVKAGSAIIDMYSKCGSVGVAMKVFHYMPEKNVFSWTSMIDGYGKNGMADEALELFDQMKRRDGAKPNHATFLSVLSACGHAGMLSSGKEIFESMERDYAVKPRMEHYACMVDVYGRMGGLQAAYDFVKLIPEKPNADVWAALLGASRLHGDVEMADIASKEIFQLNRCDRPGSYMALSHTLAAAGKWEGVCKVREVMKAREVSKEAGWSWVGTVKV